MDVLGTLLDDFILSIECLITLWKLEPYISTFEKDDWNSHRRELLQDAKMRLCLVCQIFTAGLTVGSGAVSFFSCTSK